jgi:hypothetical protein
MKRSLLSILLVMATTPLFAGSFTVHDWNGPYSFHFDGQAFNSGGAFVADIAAIGQVVADGNGNFTSGSRSITFGNTISEQTLTGTYTVNPDGTGHAVVTHQPGNLVQEFDIVLTGDGRQFNFNATKSGIPGIFVVVQGEGQKQ